MSPRRFSPSLEALRERFAPAVLTSYTGGALTISSDDAAPVDHRVRVLVRDQQVVLFVDGQRSVAGPSAPLTSIDVRLGGGNDTVTVNLLSSVGRNDLMTVRIDAGAGADVVRVRTDRMGRGSGLFTDIIAGPGADRIDVALGPVGPVASARTEICLGGDGERDVVNLASGAVGADSFVDFCVCRAELDGPAGTNDLVRWRDVTPPGRVCIGGVEQPPFTGPGTGGALPPPAPGAGGALPPAVAPVSTDLMSKRMLLGSF
ncbi:hypothetical protein [Gemmata sp.]|uniref:hypothetical protein n=1 Tax=Gemmata sp. TaxID=1914242 RepID=UPI003F6E5049